MLSIAAARAQVLAATSPLPAEDVPIADALDRVAAEPVTAAHDVPAFANSAMDGYAVAAGPAGRTLTVIGDARAGHPAGERVGPGTAIRISTGAALPDGADGVVQVERTTAGDGDVTLHAEVTPGLHVRAPGEDIAAGATVLEAGTVLGPAELGIAVAAGRASVRCARRPRVTIVSTGDELAPPGAPLQPGQIHNTNAVTLAALARRAGAEVTDVTGSADTLEATREALERALDGADLVAISGGVSVGPHDHVKPALEALGVQERFWRVALRPGRPTWFGTRDRTLVFGLPGNPVSTVVTFVLFARPALVALQGAPYEPRTTSAALGEPVARHPDRDEAVRVRVRDGVATPTGPQGSHIISSLVGADGLAIVEAGEGELPAGARVAVEALW